MKQIIIALVGSSGSGKTGLSLSLKDSLGIPTIVSYTQRPMRDGEVDGVDHYYTTEDPVGDPLAFTIYGGYKYWADHPKYLISSYVIDEKGLRELESKWSWKYKIFKVRIERADLSGISEERLKRDLERDDSDITYDAVIINNKTLEEFFEEGKNLIINFWKGI